MSRLAKDSSFPSTASTSQEDLENGASSTSSRKLRVTLLSSEWKSTKGGLSAINRELAIQLAKHPNVEVSVYLPQCSEEDKRVATSHNVRLIEAEEMPGLEPELWLSSLPDDHAVDCVIGHGVHLGRQVQLIKRHHNCKWTQVVHTAPEELGMFKSYADAISKGEKKHKVEVKLCELADQVVAVGPKLAEAFSGYLRSCGKDQDVLNLTPGIFSEFADVKQATEERRTFCVLVFGRGDNEDFQLKGYDIAAQAIAELKDISQPYKLVFVGAPSGEEEKVKEMLLEQGIDCSQLTVRCFDESREQLARLFCEVDLAIMPSRTEGFGLAALEALSAGLPVLVSLNSGLGEALKKVPYGSQSVVESEDPKEWAKAIGDVRKKDRELRLEESKELLGAYAKKYNWQEQCEILVERMMNITQVDSLERHASEEGKRAASPSITPAPNQPTLSTDGHEDSWEKHASEKGKRPASPNVIPAPKQPRLLTGCHEDSWEKHASENGKRAASPSVTPAPKQPRLSTSCHEEGSLERHASEEDKRAASPSITPAPNQPRLLTDVHEGTDNAVVVKLLKAEYSRRAQLRPLLWDNTIQLPLEHVYTRLKIVSRRKAGIKVKGGKVNMYNIFEVLGKGESVMALVEGSPGIGKTTFCLKLAYDWATKFSLHKLEFVLLLKCRDIDGDIMEAINEQLLPEDIEDKTREKLFDFIKNPDNQKRILIILDGLDELPQRSQHHVDKLLYRKILPCCHVLATSRQERGIEVRKKFIFDIHLKIEGFRNKDSFVYVRKHFKNVGSKHLSKAKGLIEEIKKNALLRALRNNPLNLLLLCVVYEDYEGELPTSRTELYQVIIQCLLRRFCAKRNLEAHEDNKALEKRFEEDILALGELAWMCLLNDRHCFRETELKELESRNKELVAREIGLLYKEESLKRLQPQHEYYFLHKTFQEYLAASYVANKLRRNQLQLFEHLSFEDVVGKYRQVFFFVSGILGEEARILFTQIGEKLKGSGDWDWCKCSKEVADFLTKSFTESGNAELMAVTLCSFLPFPVTIEIGREEFTNFIKVLKACKRFSNLLKPIALDVHVERDGRMNYLKTVSNFMKSCSQLTTVSLSIPVSVITSFPGHRLLQELSGRRCLSEFSLKLRGNCGEACFNALETKLSANAPLTSIGLEVSGSMSNAARWTLVKILSKKSLKSVSLVIYGDMQDSLAAALRKALAGQTVLKSLYVRLVGKLSFSGANFLGIGLLENSSLNDLRVLVRGELPGNWQSVVENLRLTKKALVTCTFYPNTWVKVADNQMAHFRPAAVEKGLPVPKQHLTVNLWGELSCEGTEALCEVLVRSPLSSLTLNFHGKLTVGVADCFAKCLKPQNALSSLTINIWGELTTEGGTVLQGLSDNNLTVQIKVHDVGILPDESYNALDVAFDNLTSLASLFSEVKETRKERLSLTINNQSGAIEDWAHHLGDALAENTSLTALDLTINNYIMNADLGEGLGENMLRSTSLTSFSLTINNYNNMTEGWDCILGDSLAKLSSLTTLSLEINNHSKESEFRGKGLSDSLIAMKSISTLSVVINISNMDEFWSVVLRNCLEQNTSLKKLCLTVIKGDNDGLDDDGYIYKGVWAQGLSDGLETTSSLNELTLTFNKIDLTSQYWLPILSQGLSKNKSLTTLIVTVNNYQVSRNQHLAQYLNNCLKKINSVTTLTLTLTDYSEGEQLDDQTWRHPFLMHDSVTVNTSLTTLNLTVNSCRKVSEDWLPGLCTNLMKNVPLTTLRLQVNNQCATSGSRIYDFSELLMRCRSLSLLDLTVSFYGEEN